MHHRRPEEVLFCWLGATLLLCVRVTVHPLSLPAPPTPLRHVPGFVITFMLRILAPFIYRQALALMRDVFTDPQSKMSRRMQQRTDLYPLLQERVGQHLQRTRAVNTGAAGLVDAAGAAAAAGVGQGSAAAGAVAAAPPSAVATGTSGKAHVISAGGVQPSHGGTEEKLPRDAAVVEAVVVRA